jgi:hypothetical protein
MDGNFPELFLIIHPEIGSNCCVSAPETQPHNAPFGFAIFCGANIYIGYPNVNLISFCKSANSMDEGVSTFASRTSQYTNPSLQKSQFSHQPQNSIETIKPIF